MYYNEDFSMNEYAYKPITEDGRVGYYSGKYEINYSSILTRLIQEAGRFCEHYASDLFIDWQEITEMLDAAPDIIHETKLFGFRQMGVDHKAFVYSRYENSGNNARYNYRSMWRLDIDADGKEISMKLGRVF